VKKTALLLALFSGITCLSQTNICGFDSFRQARLDNDLSYKQQEVLNEQLLQNSLTSVQGDGESRMLVYTVPVVYHIIHQGGPENVPDATIINSVNELNLRFQNAAPHYDATGHAINIQFCLATVDPWGNPTTGITRDTSFRTNHFNYHVLAEDVALKNVNRWCPATYLNVWVIKNLGSLSGIIAYSAFPAAGSEHYDGIVCMYQHLTSYVMTHEVGHYFNLYHTFNQTSCDNFNCITDGDHVCDTPPDFTDDFTCMGNSCSTDMNDTTGMSPFTSDQNELPNYMDYTGCALSFSAGQRTRMENALTLLRSSLLLSNGCGANPGGVMPVASFTVDSTSFCSGTGTFGFNSTSTNSLYTAWDFNNDGRTDAVGNSVTYTFPNSGYFPVTLTVSGYGGSHSLTQIIYVYANPYPTYPILNFHSGLSTDPILNTLFACIGSTVTLNGEFGMLNYQWSTGETTQSISFIADTTRTFYLTVTDNTGRVISNCTPFTVNVNPRLSLNIITGEDTVDCQELITLRLLPNPYWFPATNTWYRNGAWFSANQFVLGNYGIPPGYHSVWVTGNVDPNGCVTDSDTVNFLVNPPPPMYLVQQGNQIHTSFKCLFTSWYRDGVDLGVNDSVITITANGCYYASCASCLYLPTDTICIVNAGLGEKEDNGSLNIFPNPFTSQTTLSFSEEQHNTEILMTDELGREVRRILHSGRDCIIDKGELKSGIYFLYIRNRNMIHRKIIIQ
jgi:PKD repeat protein